jgi:tight adherence protein C
MDTQLLIMLSVTLSIGCLILGLYYWWGQDRATGQRVSSLVKHDRRDEDDDRYRRPPLFQLIVPRIANALRPRTGIEQQQLKLKMARAGFNGSYAVELFLSAKIVLLIVGGLAGSVGGCLYFGFREPSLFCIVITGSVLFYLPDLILHWMTVRRQEQILLALPNAIDLLIVAIEVGQGLDAAMRRVTNELSRGAYALNQEFSLYNLQLQMGRPRGEALHDLGMRSGVPDMNAFAAVLIQAERFGASIAKTMRQLSESARRKRRQTAEERAQKTAVKLVFPLVLFIFPGIFAVLVGPAVILLLRDLSAMR